MGSATTAFARRRLEGTVALLVVAILAGGTLLHHLSLTAQLPLPDSLHPRTEEGLRPRYLDRHGQPLSATFDNPLNLHDQLPLHEIPSLLQRAFIASEDRRFYHHQGADWMARGHALVQNLLALRQVRGASTISEQVVRILHPRPRTLWSRWLEGLEARELERRFTKNDILEFYLNQVPYDRRRRGVQQAAQLYFGRAPSTLDPTEILTLAVLVRAPSRLSRPENHDQLQQAVWRLAGQLGFCRDNDQAQCRKLAITLPPPTSLSLPVAADHFLRNLAKGSFLSDQDASQPNQIRTTLDAALQNAAQKNLAEQLANLQALQVHSGAALVVDHLSDEILAWVSVGDASGTTSAAWLDAVTSPRQPGSTLKPFLYALALERGWTAATRIDDSPLSGQVGDGAHPFRNYSRRHYGPLPLRQALGNSLNLPAIRTVRHTGIDPFLERLRAAGMDSLDRNAAHYGEGLALGNGEVTLLELVRGYTVLARNGIFRPLCSTLDGQNLGRRGQRVFSAEAASLIADILADPQARRLEFGDGSILRFPGETAVKTGTSNDHRDAWALGFDARHTVGVWMGNLDGRSTLGLSGASGPALVLRALFSELQRRGETRPLWRSPRLERHAICLASGERAAQGCASVDELFLPGTAPNAACPAGDHQGPALAMTPRAPTSLRLVQPTPGLLLALDPHIPDELEAYVLRLGDVETRTTERVEWLINGQVVGTTRGGEDRFLWRLRRGAHLAQARLHRGGEVEESPAVAFTVK